MSGLLFMLKFKHHEKHLEYIIWEIWEMTEFSPESTGHVCNEILFSSLYVLLNLLI